MTEIKKPQGVGEPQAASKSINANKFNWFDYRIKVVIHHLAPWFFMVGGLHG
ncbi:hypothetical protein NP590_08395 [Methylomonas sp. SURF-2]|uniref:Uncharacterized protein n=1 Tax=Methylomonas subterranea TaxID=2952225 RepID=A0ABT1TF91_9GAMM|nr:hypothetical protein [Methylomonas sp. SURF-2]MCQ8104120.1 hypothetical protein [Methylomonas sp. SURF-2]